MTAFFQSSVFETTRDQNNPTLFNEQFCIISFHFDNALFNTDMSHSANQEKYHYGLDAELQEKIGARWNQEDANTALTWIGQLAGMDLGTDFHAGLKDGK